MQTIIFFILLILSTCYSNIAQDNNITGVYYKKGVDYEYNLILKKDHSFYLKKRYQDAKPTCEGEWELSKLNLILLKCNKSDKLHEILSSGYMKDRELTIEIIAKDKLKMDNVILEKVK